MDIKISLKKKKKKIVVRRDKQGKYIVWKRKKYYLPAKKQDARGNALAKAIESLVTHLKVKAPKPRAPRVGFPKKRARQQRAPPYQKEKKEKKMEEKAKKEEKDDRKKEAKEAQKNGIIAPPQSTFLDQLAARQSLQGQQDWQPIPGKPGKFFDANQPRDQWPVDAIGIQRVQYADAQGRPVNPPAGQALVPIAPAHPFANLTPDEAHAAIDLFKKQAETNKIQRQRIAQQVADLERQKDQLVKQENSIIESLKLKAKYAAPIEVRTNFKKYYYDVGYITPAERKQMEARYHAEGGKLTPLGDAYNAAIKNKKHGMTNSWIDNAPIEWFDILYTWLPRLQEQEKAQGHEYKKFDRDPYVERMVKQVEKKIFEDLLKHEEAKMGHNFGQDIANLDKELIKLKTGAGKGKGLLGSQIDGMMKRVKPFIGTFARDQISKLPIRDKNKPWAAVINLDESDQPGSHWTGLTYLPQKKSLNYFDSFGVPMKKDMLGQVKTLFKNLKLDKETTLKENLNQYQADNSNECGFFAMDNIVKLLRGDKFPDATRFNQVAKGEKDIKKFKERFAPFKTIAEAD